MPLNNGKFDSEWYTQIFFQLLTLVDFLKCIQTSWHQEISVLYTQLNSILPNKVSSLSMNVHLFTEVNKGQPSLSLSLVPVRVGIALGIPEPVVGVRLLVAWQQGLSCLVEVRETLDKSTDRQTGKLQGRELINDMLDSQDVYHIDAAILNFYNLKQDWAFNKFVYAKK